MKSGQQKNQNTAVGRPVSKSIELDPRIPHRISHVAKAFGLSLNMIKRLKDEERITVYQSEVDARSDYVMIEEFITEYRRVFRKINDAR